MSRTTRKIQKKISERQQSTDKVLPEGNVNSLLKKLFDTEIKRSRLLTETNKEIFDTLEAVINSWKTESALEQKLQQARHELQATTDELADVHEELKKAQVEKLKLEQKLQWTKVELETTKKSLTEMIDKLNRIERISVLKSEIEHIEQEISRCESKIAKHPEAREIYEPQLIRLKETLVRYLADLKELQEGRSSENFSHDSSYAIPGGESNLSLQERLNNSDPTDEVIIRSHEDEFRLLNVWNAKDYSQDVPSDLLRNGTLPLEDFVITFATEDFSARVIVTNVTGGAITYDTTNMGSPEWADLVYFFRAETDKIVLTSLKDHALTDRVLHVWYGIETALLNPIVKERIERRRLESFAQQGKELGKNVVAYIKRVPVNVNDLLVEVESKKVEWRKQKWGVPGHWRTCASGKKVWVRPYEKGPKRGQKLENQDLRERIIIT